MLKKFRKIFNIPFKAEAKLINEGCEKLNEMALKKSSLLNNEDRKKQKDKDGICPNCGSKNIVNKIARAHGSGSISGSFVFGGGNVSGSSHIDTTEVNNCNNCGNQWKKHERMYKWSEEILASWMDDIAYYIDGKYSFSKDTIKLLKDIPAESILKTLKKVSDKCYSTTKKTITLSFLRTKFNSVYGNGK